jgi:hypothetical protein
LEDEMSRKKDVHTVPNPKGDGWINKVGGVPTGVGHRTQGTAARAGRAIAKQNESEHSIHRRDGTVGQKNS